MKDQQFSKNIKNYTKLKSYTTKFGTVIKIGDTLTLGKAKKNKDKYYFDDCFSFIVDGKISVGHARAIINSDNSIEVARNIIKKGLSVREVEKLLKKSKKSENTSELHKYLDIENELSDKIGLKTKILFNKEKKNGSLTIKFKNLDQLEYIMEKFN